MLRLCLPERTYWHDFSDNFPRPESRCIDIGNRIQGHPLLIFARVEDRRAIAGTDVIALSVSRRRVMNLKEELQQLSITDLARVENNLDRFGMRPMPAVSRIRNVAAGVPDPGRDHAGIFAYQILHTPEASA